MNVVDAQDKRNQHMRRLLGLLLGLMLLAHDIVMAGDAHSAAAFEIHSVQVESHLATTSPLISHHTESPVANDFHSSDCGTIRGAVSAPVNHRVDPEPCTGVAFSQPPDGCGRLQRTWLGIEHPLAPAVRRALLQVYRI